MFDLWTEFSWICSCFYCRCRKKAYPQKFEHQVFNRMLPLNAKTNICCTYEWQWIKTPSLKFLFRTKFLLESIKISRIDRARRWYPFSPIKRLCCAWFRRLVKCTPVICPGSLPHQWSVSDRLCPPSRCPFLLHTHVCVALTPMSMVLTPWCANRSSRDSPAIKWAMMSSESLKSACISSTLEPTGLMRNDGRRPDGVTMLTWSRGRSLAWDFTCVHRLAASHLSKGRQDGSCCYSQGSHQTTAL